MKELLAFQQSVAMAGWAVTDSVVDSATTADLRDCVAPLSQSGRGGVRNLLDEPRIASLATSPALRRFADAVLGEPCFAVRALFFDKTSHANWKVVWHQDLTVAARQRIDLPGYGPWTDKAGVPHVQPPVDVLEHMLAVLLAFRPLLLHASSPARRPMHRRVIHIEYAARPLDSPLAWHRQVA